MKKTIYLMIAMTVLAGLFISACGSPAPTAQPPVEPAPTQAPAQPEPAPTEPPAALPAATVQTFAPACQAAAPCAAPAVKDTVASDRYCVEKVPYQNILLDDGVTFEVLDPANLTCADNGTMAEGKHVIECHGSPAWKTQVKFTNTACSAPSLQTGAAQCQAGLGYDAANNCCAPMPAAASGSVTITVNMGACE